MLQKLFFSSNQFEIERLAVIILFTIPCFNTLLVTNISPPKAFLKMIFLFARWDMLVPESKFNLFCSVPISEASSLCFSSILRNVKNGLENKKKSTTPKTNMDTQNSHIWKDILFKNHHSWYLYIYISGGYACHFTHDFTWNPIQQANSPSNLSSSRA